MKLRSLINLLRRNEKPERFAAGHFYSAVPSVADITRREKTIFSKQLELRGIDVNEAGQLSLLRELKQLKHPVPFYELGEDQRYKIENDNFSYDDGPVLHYMLRKIKPSRIIEIGSGNSSACMLDTNDLYNLKVKFTFIDQDCTNLRRNLKKGDSQKIRIIESPIQDVNLSLFDELEENDLLFIDSSHVLKIGSDLPTIFFDILPRLKKGVYIHFHDIRFPFQYLRELISEKVYWNEAYFLRAFLTNNESYEITFWLNYLLTLKEAKDDLLFLPLDGWDRLFNGKKGEYDNAGGSIYLKKIK